MTKPEVRQLKKNEALNKIREICKAPYAFKCDPYDESSGGEQREESIRYIIEELEKELSNLK